MSDVLKEKLSAAVRQAGWDNCAAINDVGCLTFHTASDLAVETILSAIAEAGFAVVPREPTPEMLEAGKPPMSVLPDGRGGMTSTPGIGCNASSIWSAMITEAAKP